MPSFSIPLSGLAASSQALNIVSNNLANLNTVGYKDQTANFKDLFYQNYGSDGAGDPIQVGAGNTIGSVATNYTNGSTQNTGVDSNAAITGSGFFVTQQSDGTVQYTRAGDFTVNNSGQLVTAGGQMVMGYPAVSGVVNPGASLSPLMVGPGQISPPSATTTMQQQTNLDASATAGTKYSTTQAVFDSLGVSHTVTFNYTKDALATNTWTYQATLPAADITGGSGAPTEITKGTLTFDSSGNLTPPASPVLLKIANLADGAADMKIDWALATPAGKSLLTQVASDSTTSNTNQDGHKSGTLQTYSIMQDGTIEAKFSNGETQTIGQIALASFANNQGLQMVGGNSCQSSLASGAAVIGTPNSGGRGTLTGGSLELSNVDISTEFTNLIVVQRAFQANARVITTFDTISSQTVHLQAGS